MKHIFSVVCGVSLLLIISLFFAGNSFATEECLSTWPEDLGEGRCGYIFKNEIADREYQDIEEIYTCTGTKHTEVASLLLCTKKTIYNLRVSYKQGGKCFFVKLEKDDARYREDFTEFKKVTCPKVKDEKK